MDILHQRTRIPKHMMIDPLQDVADNGSSLVINDAKGVIDMTASVWLGILELAQELECA
jgi:hypothetical protein